eukprot:6375257-Pyramimonas_sp.AAC.1
MCRNVRGGHTRTQQLGPPAELPMGPPARQGRAEMGDWRGGQGCEEGGGRGGRRGDAGRCILKRGSNTT